MRVLLWGPAVERRDRFADELRAMLGDERFEAARLRGRTARFEDMTPPSSSGQAAWPGTWTISSLIPSGS